MLKLLRGPWRIFVFCVAIIYLLVESAGAGDLLIFLSAAGHLGTGENIFTHSYFGGFYYYYSVLFALVLKPFWHLPYFFTKFLWLLLNLSAYVHLFYMLANSKAVVSLNDKHRKFFLWAVFIFSFRFLHENLHASQITILILWTTVYGLLNIDRGLVLKGSFFLALGINIKLLPVVFLPYLLYRKQFVAFFAVIVIYALLLFLPSLFIGHNENVVLLQSWLRLINPANTNHLLDVDERSFHGLTTLLSTLLVKNVPDLHALDLRRNIADIPVPVLGNVILVVRLLFAAMTLYFLKWPPFNSARHQWHRALEISYLLLVIPLIFPHQQHYAFMFIVPAYACALYYLFLKWNHLQKSRKNVLIVFMAIIYLCANLRTVLGEFNHLYEHYKILTYGALMLTGLMLWLANTKRMSEIPEQGHMS